MVAMSIDATKPDTIVLIHGFWVTPRSWEQWVTHYEKAGYRVLAPAYPGFEVEVEALNADPTPIEQLTVPAIIEHLESVVGGLDKPPILMGHSAGGVFTQILLDHGFGAVGVAINSAPTEGVKRRAAVADQGGVPRAEEPGQPAQGGRLHARAVALRVHEHVQRGRVEATVRAVPRPGVGRDLLGQRAGEHPPRAPDDCTSTTRTPIARRCCSSPATRITSCRRRSSSPTRSTTRPKARSPR